MVGRDDVTNASALNSVTFNLARLVGPSIAGVLIATVDEGWVFSITAVSMAGVVSALVRMDPTKLERIERLGRAKGQVREGFTYVRGRRDLSLVILMMLVVSGFGLNFPVTLALMARQTFHNGAEGYGLLSSSVAVGSLVAAGVATRRKRPRQRTLILGAFTFGVAETAAAVMPSYWSFALSLMLVGATILTFTTTCNATIQLGVEGPMRGRVMSLYLMVFLGSTPIGAPIVGAICEQWGPRWGLVVGGVASMLAAVVGAIVVSRGQGRPLASLRMRAAAPELEREPLASLR
jgi:MFS family permease